MVATAPSAPISVHPPKMLVADSGYGLLLGVVLDLARTGFTSERPLARHRLPQFPLHAVIRVGEGNALLDRDVSRLL
jgi:hypothetical protein